MIKRPTELHIKWDQNNVDDPGKKAKKRRKQRRSRDGGKKEVVGVKE